MLIDSVYVKCPQCQEIHSDFNVESYHVFGGIAFTDSYTDALSIPDMCPICQCTKCKMYFLRYQNRCEEVEVKNYPDILTNVSVDGYFDVLSANRQLGRDLEINLRINLQHLLNHEFRKILPAAFNVKKPIESLQKNLSNKPVNYLYLVPELKDHKKRESYRQLRTANLIKLEELIRSIEENEMYMLILTDVLRSLGKFQEAKEALAKIPDYEIDLSEKMIRLQKKLIKRKKSAPYGYHF